MVIVMIAIIQALMEVCLRLTLGKQNITGPFIIMSFIPSWSLGESGLAGKYANEVESLDWSGLALPSSYENLRIIRPCSLWHIGQQDWFIATS